MVIAGSTGLIGSTLIQLLISDDRIGEIVAITRRPLNIVSIKLKEIIVDFDNLSHINEQTNGDAIYFCLGTTKSKTPDNQLYRKIEHDYSLTLAGIGKHNNVPQFHYISALGANSTSNFFYNRIKGITEDDLNKVGLKSLHIYQPSLLIGERSELRIAEKLFTSIMNIVNPLLQGRLKKYQSIKAITVAQAMLNQTLKEVEGIHIYPSDKIKELV